MRIAFVGKGGAGKTTASSLFAHHVSLSRPVLAIDADINMHMAELLTGAVPHEHDWLSSKNASEEIRAHLSGANPRIKTTAHFKKTTPPGTGSRLVNPLAADDWVLQRYGARPSDTLTVVTVGTYEKAGVASSCYHNNLSVLENILSHMVDGGIVVADMVAGTDAFASTLFAQFDALVFVAEPTARSLAVLRQYIELAEHAGVADKLWVVANKVDDEEDVAFVREVAKKRLAGILHRSSHLVAVDKGREPLDSQLLQDTDRVMLGDLMSMLESKAISQQERLPQLWELHKTYVAQGFVKDRFGDLTHQIDPDFVYPKG